VSTYYDENELDDNVRFNGNVVKRLLGMLSPHKKTMLSSLFAIMVVSLLDAYFTLINKRIIDEGIVAGDKTALVKLFTMYGAIVLIQAAAVFFFIYLVGLQGNKCGMTCASSSSTIYNSFP